MSFRTVRDVIVVAPDPNSLVNRDGSINVTAYYRLNNDGTDDPTDVEMIWLKIAPPPAHGLLGGDIVPVTAGVQYTTPFSLPDTATPGVYTIQVYVFTSSSGIDVQTYATPFNVTVTRYKEVEGLAPTGTESTGVAGTASESSGPSLTATERTAPAGTSSESSAPATSATEDSAP